MQVLPPNNQHVNNLTTNTLSDSMYIELNDDNESQLFDMIPTKSEGIYKIITADFFKYLTFNIENTKANYTFHLKPGANSDYMKLNIEHNLSYFKQISKMIHDELENPAIIDELRKKIINTLVSKSGDSPEYYVSMEDQRKLQYKSFRYKYSETSNEKMYCTTYSITRNDVDARDTAMKVFNNSAPLYFQNIEEFHDYIKNKTVSFQEIVYFQLFVNLDKMQFYYIPHVHSINFNKEPTMDNSIRSFNSFTKEEQQKTVHEMISAALENQDYKDMKQPSFYFKPMYFKMDDIDMKDLLEYTSVGTKYKPTLWGGRSGNMNMENAKETFTMCANENLVTFLNNVHECLMLYKDEFKDKLLEMKKVKSVKISKKDDIAIKLPITDHYEVEYVYDETEEEEVPKIIEGGKYAQSVQIKQPVKVEDTEWNDIPLRGLYYTLKNVSINITKLFYYENTKELRLQISFSKYIKVQKEHSSDKGPSFATFYENSKRKRQHEQEQEQSQEDMVVKEDYQESAYEEEYTN